MDYKDFIENILRDRGRFNCKGYKERHHILPKCMGGTNDKNNLIDLYASEHFEAHRLLAIENPKEIGLIYAWFMMSKGGGSSKKRKPVSSKDYEEAKIAYCKLCSDNFSGENNPNYGNHKLSGENNPMYGVHRYGENAPMYGKHLSKEAKEKISKARIGVYCGENHPFFGKTGKLHHASIPVLQFSKEGQLIKEWESMGSAARELSLDKSGIINCCANRILTCGGFVWVKKEDFLKVENYKFPDFKNIKTPKEKGKKHPCSKAVVQYDKDGNFIKNWDCISDVQRELNICSCNITMCCKYPDKHKTTGGYKWRYKENDEAKR